MCTQHYAYYRYTTVLTISIKRLTPSDIPDNKYTITNNKRYQGNVLDKHTRFEAIKPIKKSIQLFCHQPVSTYNGECVEITVDR